MIFASSRTLAESNLNYRHAFHAGNFADVVKHAALALCLDRLNQKPAPYRYIDTHAGIGAYDLEGDEAERSPEWKDGVGRVWEAERGAPQDVRNALAPWLNVIRGMNAVGLKHYPGSPFIAQRMLRNALRVRAARTQHRAARGHGRDRRVKIEQRDGFEALAAIFRRSGAASCR
jgi:23S rRNA (adenine2030-N6)-methyltransferase